MNTRHVGDGEGDHHVSASCRQVFEAIVDANDFQPRVYRLDGRRTDGAVDAGSRAPSHQDSQAGRWRGHWSIPFQHELCLSSYFEAIPRWAAGPISWRYPLRLSNICFWACRPTPPAGAVLVVESPAKTGNANHRDQNPWLPEPARPCNCHKGDLGRDFSAASLDVNRVGNDGAEVFLHIVVPGRSRLDPPDLIRRPWT